MTAGTGDQPAHGERLPAEPERPLTPGEALAKLFMTNADNGHHHANDALVEALRQRALAIQTLARPARWFALSPVDHEVHLLVPEGEHSGGLLARCGHLVPTGTQRHDQPPPGPPCEPCRLMFLEDHTKSRPAAG